MNSVADTQLNENDYLILDQLKKIYIASPVIFTTPNKRQLISEIINDLENELKGGGLRSLVSSIQIHPNQIEEVFNQFIFKKSSDDNSWENAPQFNELNTRYPTMRSHYQGIISNFQTSDNMGIYQNAFDNRGIYRNLYESPNSYLFTSGLSQNFLPPSPYGVPPSPYENPAAFRLRPPPFGAQYSYGGKKISKNKKSKKMKKKATKKLHKYTKNNYAKKNKSKKLKRRR